MAEYKGSGPHSDEIPQTESIPQSQPWQPLRSEEDYPHLSGDGGHGRPTLVLRYDVCPLPQIQERESVCVSMCLCAWVICQ